MHPTLRRILPLILTALFAAGCGGSSVAAEDVPALPAAGPEQIRALLAGSEIPVVLNVWASWCGPCRSEAPLLRAAAGDARVRFVGVDVRDDQDSARRFIAEFGLDGFEHYFDPSGAVAADLGGSGVPRTFFFAPGGDLVHLHFGVLDERTLALQIDELVRGTG